MSADSYQRSNMRRMMTQFLMAEQQPAEAPGGAQGAGASLTPFFFIAAIGLFFFIVIMPAQRRQKKEQEKMIATLKRGAKIMTKGGIVGTIVGAKDGEDEIVIRSEDTRLRIKRDAVLAVIGSDEAEANKS
jgi:preprotein translocase subunit YajC